MVKYGKWQKGDLNKLTADDMAVKFKSAGIGVQKPTAIDQKKKKWRIYHKPLTPGEFWD